MTALSKSQVDKLGKKLAICVPGEWGEGNHLLSALQEFRSTFVSQMGQAQKLLENSLEIATVSRLKTINTIVEKLRRERTRLSEMQDIGGIRIVKEMYLYEQDSLVEKICSLFPSCRVVDRRIKPSHGYRAVHIVSTVEGRKIEIQVRTAMQDAWAQAVEKLADLKGRDVRYGIVTPDSEELFNKLIEISTAISHGESLVNETRQLYVSTPPSRLWPTQQRQVVLHRERIRKAHARCQQMLNNAKIQVQQFLANLGQNL